MKRVVFLLLGLVAVLSWSPPTQYTDGTPIAWESTAEMVYIPAVSTDGATWQDQPMTALLWADVPSPAAGSTLYYTCRVVLDNQPSGYAPPVSLTVAPYIPPEPAPKPGWGKGGKKK